MHRTFLIIPLLLAATAGFAQKSADYAPPVRYEVELIIFRHLDQTRNTPEMPTEGSLFQDSPLSLNPAEDSASAFIRSLEPTVGISPSPISTVEAPYEPAADPAEPGVSFYLMDVRARFPDFVPLEDRAMQLTREYGRLARNDAYQPLLHLGWVQPAKVATEAVPYRFSFQDPERNDLSGSITVYRERYLHLDLDLALSPARDEYGAGSNFYTRDTLRQMRIGGRRLHKLTQSRRVNAPSWHYFDHPLFGVIARVDKIVVETDEPATGSR
jgi:hypothetical protein